MEDRLKAQCLFKDPMDNSSSTITTTITKYHLGTSSLRRDQQLLVELETM